MKATTVPFEISTGTDTVTVTAHRQGEWDIDRTDAEQLKLAWAKGQVWFDILEINGESVEFTAEQLELRGTWDNNYAGWA